MKVLTGALSALCVAALLLVSPALRADDKDGQKHWDKFDRLKKELSLSDDQVSQWKDAEKGQKEEGKLVRDKIKADMANLAVLVDQKASDEDLSAALKTLEADHKAQADQREKIDPDLEGHSQAHAAGETGRIHGRKKRPRRSLGWHGRRAQRRTRGLEP